MGSLALEGAVPPTTPRSKPEIRSPHVQSWPANTRAAFASCSNRFADHPRQMATTPVPD